MDMTILKGSPPLARGILFLLFSHSPGFGITPACAGNTIWDLMKYVKKEDHPRLRGEYIPNNLAVTQKSGSPPLARGILKGESNEPIPFGITPACAGNTE